MFQALGDSRARLKLVLRWLIPALLISAASLVACRQEVQTVTIFHAGSLAPLLEELGSRFQEHYSAVEIRLEASGSLDVVRKVTELGKPCDIVITADSRLIDRFLIPKYAESYYSFLGNEMVLATAQNELLESAGPNLDWDTEWYEILFAKRYSYGISDPNRDPAGYYSHLVWKLAEIHYNKTGLYRRFSLRLNERWMRPKSSELVALLQTGHLDFAFIYKSSALQNNLAYLTLPPQVSLGETGYAEFYSKAFVRVADKQPDSVFEINGGPIQYGLALLSDSNPAANRFVEFLLSPESQNLYREMGYQVTPIQETVKGAEQ